MQKSFNLKISKPYKVGKRGGESKRLGEDRILKVPLQAKRIKGGEKKRGRKDSIFPITTACCRT